MEIGKFYELLNKNFDKKGFVDVFRLAIETGLDVLYTYSDKKKEFSAYSKTK